MANCIRCGRTISGFTLGKKICGWCKQHEAAQRGEGSQYQPVMATPWARRETMPMLVTQAIFGINIAVFVGMLLAGASLMSGPGGDGLLAWGANNGAYTLTGQWWRLLTSCFVHIGIIHLGFNMWCLWSLGGLAERLYGHVTFACIYLLCGIGGSLGSVFWHSSPIMSAGASGAIFGIAGAVIASMKLGEFSSSEMAQSTMKSLMAFVGYNVVFGLVSGVTDNACHVGGLVTGLVLGALVAKVAPVPRLMPRLGLLLLVGAVLAGAGYEMQHKRAYPYLMMRASAELEEGKTDAAISLYQKAIKLRPGAAGAIHFKLAQMYSQKKDLSGAEKELQQVLAAYPKDEEVLNELGETRLELNETASARQSYEQLLAANSGSAEAHAGLGSVACQEGNSALALKEYGQAEGINGTLAGLHGKEGACLLKMKRYDEAIADFRKEIAVSGEDVATERGLAAAYKAKGMTAEADAASQMAEKAKNAE